MRPIQEISLLARIMPFNAAMETVQYFIGEYKKNPTPTNKSHLAAACTMLALNVANEGMSVKDILKADEEILNWAELMPKSN